MKVDDILVEEIAPPIAEATGGAGNDGSATKTDRVAVTVRQLFNRVNPYSGATLSIAPFYSQLERVLAAKMPNAASPEQVRAIIDPSKGSGIKPEEMSSTAPPPPPTPPRSRPRHASNPNRRG